MYVSFELGIICSCMSLNNQFFISFSPSYFALVFYFTRS